MCKPEHGHPAYGLPVFQYPCRCVSRSSFHTSVQSPKVEFARSTGRAKVELNCSTASSLHCLEEGPWTRPNQAGPTRLISNQGIIDTYLSVALLAQFRTAGHLGCLSFSCRPLANSIIEKPCYRRSCSCSARPPSSTLCMPPKPGRLRYLLQQVPAANRAESTQMTDRGQCHS